MEPIIITREQENLRIDKVLASVSEEYTRSYIQKLITSENILVNGKPVKPSYKVLLGDCITMDIPPLTEPQIPAEAIPLSIIYEDNDIILIDKPKGMVVHPAAGHFTGTLVNALLYHCKDELSGINGVMRPGIVHRIDKDTTGILMVCKNDFAHNHIAEQLKEHRITRRYYAVVYGNVKEESGTVHAPIGRHPTDRKKMAINQNGRDAITHYRVIEHFKNYAWIECRLETGRTHQIRVHMASIGHPLLGDSVYGSDKNPFHLQGQALHAYVLGFIHPRTGAYMEFQSELPDYFVSLLDTLRKIAKIH